MIYENIGIRATSSASQMPPHAEVGRVKYD